MVVHLMDKRVKLLSPKVLNAHNFKQGLFNICIIF